MPAESALKQLVYQTLVADAGILAAGLAADPRPGVSGPAVLPYTLSTLTSPVYPCVTLHVAVTTPAYQFEGGAPTLPAEPIDDSRLDIEIWTGTQKNDALIAAVAGRIEALFRNQSYALPDGASYAFRFVQLPYKLDLGPDAALKAYWGVMSYLVHVQRSL